ILAFKYYSPHKLKEKTIAIVKLIYLYRIYVHLRKKRETEREREREREENGQNIGAHTATHMQTEMQQYCEIMQQTGGDLNS
ncbi:hypothetical protein ACMBCM_06735, partial [Spiroplasma sp. K1]